MDEIRDKIEGKLKAPGLIKKIAGELSNSELNSFNLELSRLQSEKISPAGLLNNYSQNRFLLPAKVDAVSFREYEIKWLKEAGKKGFQPIQLSPLAPLGSCSVMSFVNQNNVVSASRITEVVSDATNVLALQVAKEFKSDKSKRIIKYSAAHRHTRAQYFDNPLFSAHFGAFCMVSGGLDPGGYSFELEEIKIHLQFYLKMLLKDFQNDFTVKVYYKNAGDDFRIKLDKYLKKISKQVRIVDNESDDTRDYYDTVRIKIFIKYRDKEIDVADMGFVDWTRKLLNNKKHRLLISGAGLELVYKIKS